MTDHNKVQSPGPQRFSFSDPRWQTLDALRTGLRHATLILSFCPIDDEYQPFFVHGGGEDDYMFIEQPFGEDKLPRSFEVTEYGDGFTLKAKTGIRNEDWDKGLVDDAAGLIHMGLQDELGFSQTNEEDVNRFSRLVEAFARDMVAKRVQKVPIPKQL